MFFKLLILTFVNANIGHNFEAAINDLKNKQGRINLNNKIIDEYLERGLNKEAAGFHLNKKYEIVVTIKTIITQIERLERNCFSLEFDCRKLGSTNINTPTR